MLAPTFPLSFDQKNKTNNVQCAINKSEELTAGWQLLAYNYNNSDNGNANVNVLTTVPVLS